MPKFSQFRAGESWPCSFAGTLPGDKDLSDADVADAQHKLFWWIYPSTNKDAPVAIWLNGGPGASSTFANFLFSGPLRISEQANAAESTSDFEVYTTEENWLDQATMIYIDQPVGTGFSYSKSE